MSQSAFFLNFYIKLTKKKMKKEEDRRKKGINILKKKSIWYQELHSTHTNTHVIYVIIYMYSLQSSLQHLLHRKP